MVAQGFDQGFAGPHRVCARTLDEAGGQPSGQRLQHVVGRIAIKQVGHHRGPEGATLVALHPERENLDEPVDTGVGIDGGPGQDSLRRRTGRGVRPFIVLAPQDRSQDVVELIALAGIGRAQQEPTGGIGTFFGDVSGNRLPLSQELTANIAADYNRDIAWGQLNLNAAISYNGDYKFDPDNVVGQDAYTNVNLSANLTLPNDVTLGLFVRNLTDNEVISYSTAATPLGYITTYDNPPRTWGASVRYRF